jgi:hypothetical protein
MGLLAVVLSTFVDGWASVGLLIGAGAITAAAVLSFGKALRREREAAGADLPPGKIQQSSKVERSSKEAV